MQIVCTLSKNPRLDLCSDAPHGWALCEGWREDKRKGKAPAPIAPTYYGTNLEAALQAAVKLLAHRRAVPPTTLADILASLRSIRDEILEVTRVERITAHTGAR